MQLTKNVLAALVAILLHIAAAAPVPDIETGAAPTIVGYFTSGKNGVYPSDDSYPPSTLKNDDSSSGSYKESRDAAPEPVAKPEAVPEPAPEPMPRPAPMPEPVPQEYASYGEYPPPYGDYYGYGEKPETKPKPEPKLEAEVEASLGAVPEAVPEAAARPLPEVNPQLAPTRLGTRESYDSYTGMHEVEIEAMPDSAMAK